MRGGFVNGLHPVFGNVELTFGATYQLSANAGGGKTFYAYVRLTNSMYRAEVRFGDSVPLDEPNLRHFPLFAVTEARDSAGNLTGALGLVRYAFENIEYRFPPSLTTEAHFEADGSCYLDVVPGAVHVAVADLGRASGFTDSESVRPGEWRNALAAKNWSVGRITQTMSLWCAVEYPATGALIAAALTRRLNFTATTALPASVPWIVASVRSAATDGSYTGSTLPDAGKSNESDGGAASGGLPPSGNLETPATDSLDKAKPATAVSYVDTHEDTSYTVALSTNITGTGSIRTITRTWKNAADEVVGTSTAKFYLSGQIYCALGWYAAWYKKTEDLGESNRRVEGVVTRWDVTTVAYSHRAEWVNRDSGVVYAGVADGQGTGSYGGNLTISAGYQYGYLRVVRTITTSVAHWYWVAGPPNTSGYTTTTQTVIVANLAINGQKAGDLLAPDAPADRPGDKDGQGRPGRGGAAATSPAVAVADNQKATDATGAAITTRVGTGLWVYEIARVYPSGRMDQLHVGDIRCFPAAVVQSRTT